MSLSVCLCVNQGCTLVILRAQTYWWTHKPKTASVWPIYWACGFHRKCVYSCAVSWASHHMGWLLHLRPYLCVTDVSVVALFAWLAVSRLMPSVMLRDWVLNQVTLHRISWLIWSYIGTCDRCSCVAVLAHIAGSFNFCHVLLSCVFKFCR